METNNTLNEALRILADKQVQATERLGRMPKSDEYTGDRMYILGRINTLIEVQKMLKRH